MMRSRSSTFAARMLRWSLVVALLSAIAVPSSVLLTKSVSACLVGAETVEPDAPEPNDDGSEQRQQQEQPADDQAQCGYYLAVSSTSTPEEPRWGVYTTKALHKGDPILYGDVAINIFNFIGNQLKMDHETAAEQNYQGFLERTVDFVEQFVWIPNSSGGQYELAPEEGTAVTAVPGVGVLASMHPKLSNADWHHGSAYWKPQWNEPAGVAHPGRGGYSSFYEATMMAKSEIQPGMEIFVNYGDNWEDDDNSNDDDEDSNRLTTEDHDKVDKTITKILAFFDKHEGELEDAAVADIFNFLMIDVMSAAAGKQKGNLIRDLLPSTLEELRRVPDAGGSLAWSQPAAVRSVEWLQKFGRCMDKIRPGPSTIPNAGRGAFAVRAIEAGDMVAPVPLVHIATEDVLEMYELVKATDTDEDEWVRTQDNTVTGTQLLINYCYGHPESSMVFLPVGSSAALINHSKDAPNAKLVWSDHPNHHQHWFDLTAEQLLEEDNLYLGLMMEVVALRPIEQGEEIFIDYGEEWQAAWDEHVQEWKESQESGDIPTQWPTRAADLMEAHRDGVKPIYTASDEETYPDNVLVKCFMIVKKPLDEPLVNDLGQKVRLWVNGTATTTPFDSDNLFQCAIQTRRVSEEHVYEYDVIFESPDDPTSVTLVRNVPHQAVIFVDKPGTGDQFHPRAFRHYIGIPDDIFPDGEWRDEAEDDHDEL